MLPSGGGAARFGAREGHRGGREVPVHAPLPRRRGGRFGGGIGRRRGRGGGGCRRGSALSGHPPGAEEGAPPGPGAGGGADGGQEAGGDRGGSAGHRLQGGGEAPPESGPALSPEAARLHGRSEEAYRAAGREIPAGLLGGFASTSPSESSGHTSHSETSAALREEGAVAADSRGGTASFFAEERRAKKGRVANKREALERSIELPQPPAGQMVVS